MYLREKPHVLVIGCGVSGLTTADLLLDAGYTVEIWGQTKTLETTSSVAAAFWFPYQVFPRDRVSGWARESYHTFSELADLGETGVLRRSVHELVANPQTPALVDMDPDWVGQLPAFYELESQQMPPSYRRGYCYPSFVIDMPRYLPWLVARVRNKGARITNRRVVSLKSLGRWEKTGVDGHTPGVIVNCAGLGARELNSDPATYPMMGQVVRVENPGLTHITVDEGNPGGLTYIVPRTDDCILGGTTIRGQEQATICGDTTESILARCRALEPKLTGAKVLSSQSGLRPCRPEVCLMDVDTSLGYVLVHNYGHGGAGITLSWGCAAEVRQRLEARRNAELSA